MRPTVYSSPGVGVEESIYNKSTLYTSASVYKEWEDPQEWDENDIPPDNSLQKIPVDSVGWKMSAAVEERPGTMGVDSVGWGMSFKLEAIE